MMFTNGTRSLLHAKTLHSTKSRPSWPLDAKGLRKKTCLFLKQLIKTLSNCGSLVKGNRLLFLTQYPLARLFLACGTASCCNLSDELVCICLRNTLFECLWSAFDKSVCFAKTKTSDCAYFLDDCNFLCCINFIKGNGEFSLLFCCCACCWTCCNCYRSCGRNAELLFHSFYEISCLLNGHVCDCVKNFIICESCHIVFSIYYIFHFAMRSVPIACSYEPLRKICTDSRQL